MTRAPQVVGVRATDEADEAGVALVAVLLLVILIGMMANLVFVRSTTLARDSARDSAQLRAHYAAQGGLAKARQSLRADPGFRGGRYRIGTCVVDVRVQRVGAALQIEAVAEFESGAQAVVVRRRATVPPS